MAGTTEIRPEAVVLLRDTWTVAGVSRQVRVVLGAATVAVLGFGGGMLAQVPAPTGAAPAAADAAVSTMVQPAVSPLLTTPVAQLTPQQVAGMQKQLADWPQLGRYRAENQTLGAPATEQKRVVFYGDSITDGWGRRHGKFFPDQPWVNRGISGQTTPQMLVRFQQDVVALHPEAVVILAGVNDIAGNTGAETLPEIEANWRSMAAIAKEAHIRVVVSSALPAGSFPWHPGVDPREEVRALNTWLQSFASEQGLVYLDYFPAMVGPNGGMRDGLSVDGIHPNDAGYAIMEPLARAAVLKSLAMPRP